MYFICLSFSGRKTVIIRLFQLYYCIEWILRFMFKMTNFIILYTRWWSRFVWPFWCNRSLYYFDSRGLELLILCEEQYVVVWSVKKWNILCFQNQSTLLIHTICNKVFRHFIDATTIIERDVTNCYFISIVIIDHILDIV